MKIKIKISLFMLVIVTLSIGIVYATYRAFSISQGTLNFTINMASTTGGGGVVTTYTIVPKLSDGMVPVKPSGSGWVVCNPSDITWFSYDKLSKQWANVMLMDGLTTTNHTNQQLKAMTREQLNLIAGETVTEMGSMYVWIPRFEYKIDYYTTAEKTELSGNGTTFTKYGIININFISPITISPTSGYTIHPAFSNGTATSFANGEWDSNISGFWMAKFEASNATNTYNSKDDIIKIVPDHASWSNLGVGDIFDVCKEMNSVTNAVTYGISSDDSVISPHMMKNSEWGAVAYLEYSDYGNNGVQPYINSYMLTTNPRKALTGFGSNGITVGRISAITADNRYNGQYGVLSTTNGNMTGVYDMNGGLNEYTAAYFTGAGTNSLTSAGNTKYSTEYTRTTGKISVDGKIGDAAKETNGWDNNIMGDSNKTNEIAFTTTLPYFMRGGGPTNGTSASVSGMFSYVAANGVSGTGGSSPDYRGFRPVIIVE